MGRFRKEGVPVTLEEKRTLTNFNRSLRYSQCRFLRVPTVCAYNSREIITGSQGPVQFYIMRYPPSYLQDCLTDKRGGGRIM